jgi:hypothetical protein
MRVDYVRPVNCIVFFTVPYCNVCKISRRQFVVRIDVLRQPMSFIFRKGENSVQGGSNMTGTNCDLFTHK